MASELYSMLDYTRALYGREFFKTKSGQYGFCSTYSRTGDKVVVVAGIYNPLILRPLENGRHMPVVSAYCTGIMFGEAILRPLPDSVECVFYSLKRSTSFTFRNNTTKRLAYTDPRLSPLSAAWRDVISKDTPHRPRYEHIKTGEIRFQRCDPRCDVDALRKRGVKIDTFTLV